MTLPAVAAGAAAGAAGEAAGTATASGAVDDGAGCAGGAAGGARIVAALRQQPLLGGGGPPPSKLRGGVARYAVSTQEREQAACEQDAGRQSTPVGAALDDRLAKTAAATNARHSTGMA